MRVRGLRLSPAPAPCAPSSSTSLPLGCVPARERDARSPRDFESESKRIVEQATEVSPSVCLTEPPWASEQFFWGRGMGVIDVDIRSFHTREKISRH